MFYIVFIFNYNLSNKCLEFFKFLKNLIEVLWEFLFFIGFWSEQGLPWLVFQYNGCPLIFLQKYQAIWKLYFFSLQKFTKFQKIYEKSLQISPNCHLKNHSIPFIFSKIKIINGQSLLQKKTTIKVTWIVWQGKWAIL